MEVILVCLLLNKAHLLCFNTTQVYLNSVDYLYMCAACLCLCLGILSNVSTFFLCIVFVLTYLRIV